jgi:hypothetical protein
MRKLIPLLALSAACSTAAPATSPADAGSSGGDAGDGGPVECSPPPGGQWQEGRDAPAHCVREVTGRAAATGGAPLPGLTITLCGVVCFGAVTDAAGAFKVDVNARLPDGGYAVFFHGRPRHASVFVRLPDAPPERLDLGPPVELAPLTAGDALPADDAPAATVTAGPVSLRVEGGTTWELSFEDLADDAEGRKLRYAKVPVDQAPAFAKGAALVYALAPFDAKPSKKVGITLSDTAGLAAATPVEIIAMGGTNLDAVNTSGLPVVAARGRVSADGTKIETDPGEGLGLVTWIAVRAAR